MRQNLRVGVRRLALVALSLTSTTYAAQQRLAGGAADENAGNIVDVVVQNHRFVLKRGGKPNEQIARDWLNAAKTPDRQRGLVAAVEHAAANASSMESRRIHSDLHRLLVRELEARGLGGQGLADSTRQAVAASPVRLDREANPPAIEPVLLVDEAELCAIGIRKIAVPTLTGARVESETLSVLTNVVVVESSRVPGLHIVGAADIEAMLGFEKQKDLLGCADDVLCVAEIGGALGVDGLLAFSVGKLGGTYVLIGTLIDVKNTRALIRVDLRTKAGEEELLELMAAMTRAVLRPVASCN